MFENLPDWAEGLIAGLVVLCGVIYKIGKRKSKNSAIGIINKDITDKELDSMLDTIADKVVEKLKDKK